MEKTHWISAYSLSKRPKMYAAMLPGGSNAHRGMRWHVLIVMT